MSIKDKASGFNAFIQHSLSRAMGKAENIHQIMAEMPLDVLKELGYSEEKAENLKSSHRKMLRIVYSGLGKTQRDFGNLVVRQADELDKLAGGLFGTMKPTDKPRPAATKKAAMKKSAKKPTRKSTKKSPAKASARPAKKSAKKATKKAPGKLS